MVQHSVYPALTHRSDQTSLRRFRANGRAVGKTHRRCRSIPWGDDTSACRLATCGLVWVRVTTRSLGGISPARAAACTKIARILHAPCKPPNIDRATLRLSRSLAVASHTRNAGRRFCGLRLAVPVRRHFFQPILTLATRRRESTASGVNLAYWILRPLERVVDWINDHLEPARHPP